MERGTDPERALRDFSEVEDEIAPDVAHGAQSVIEEQVTNGVAVRMALLYLLSGGTARLDGE